MGPGAAGGAFAALRSEYEDALRDFVTLRYGGPAADSGSALAFDRRGLYADLARLLGRGFPKEPRHEKERMRYERARYLVRSRLRAWAEGYPELLDEFESTMLDLKAAGDRESFDEALALLAALLEYHERGVDEERAVIGLEFARFRAPREEASRCDTRPAAFAHDRDALCGFLFVLVEDMALGPAFS